MSDRWPVRVCVWCKVGVLPVPVGVYSTCGECGSRYTSEVVLLSDAVQWGWVRDRFGCTVEGTAEYFTITVDYDVWNV